MKFLLKATILAAALALPFTVSGGEVGAIQDFAALPPAAEGDMRTPDNYDCCWIFYMGRWYCYNCVMGG